MKYIGYIYISVPVNCYWCYGTNKPHERIFAEEIG